MELLSYFFTTIVVTASINESFKVPIHNIDILFSLLLLSYFRNEIDFTIND